MFQEPLSVVTFITRAALFMRLLQLLTLKLALKEVYYKARHMKEQVIAVQEPTRVVSVLLQLIC